MSMADPSTSRGLAGDAVVGSIPVQLTVRFGSARLSVRELRALTEGSVVRLDRPVDGPVDICVNDLIIARGEIVAIDQDVAVRITEIPVAPGAGVA